MFSRNVITSCTMMEALPHVDSARWLPATQRRGPRSVSLVPQVLGVSSESAKVASPERTDSSLVLLFALPIIHHVRPTSSAIPEEHAKVQTPNVTTVARKGAKTARRMK